MNSKLKLIIYRNSDFIKSQIFKLNYQIGGGSKLTVEYKNNKYTFEEIHDDNFYVLYSIDKNPFDCVVVVISKEFKIAEIHGINNIESFMIYSNTNVESKLLQITIMILKKYQHILDINYIVLTDNSLKKCNNKDIKLSTMLILLTGDTWFGKYGFKLYDNSKNKLDYYLNKKYDKIIVSIDAKNGIVMTEGWKSSKGKADVLTFAAYLKDMGFGQVIYTDTLKDGTLTGPNIKSIKELLKETNLKVIASGGISSLDDILKLKLLEKLGVVGVIIGKALYEGKFTLSQAIKM